MNNICRVLIMTAVTIPIMAVLLGGARNFQVALSYAVFFWGIPALVAIGMLHSLHCAVGKKAGLLIGVIGLFPLFFAAYFGFRGDREYIGDIIEAGLLWSAAWLVTSLMVKSR